MKRGGGRAARVILASKTTGEVVNGYINLEQPSCTYVAHLALIVNLIGSLPEDLFFSSFHLQPAFDHLIV